jgi:hypothetical protein
MQAYRLATDSAGPVADGTPDSSQARSAKRKKELSGRVYPAGTKSPGGTIPKLAISAVGVAHSGREVLFEEITVNLPQARFWLINKRDRSAATSTLIVADPCPTGPIIFAGKQGTFELAASLGRSYFFNTELLVVLFREVKGAGWG